MAVGFRKKPRVFSCRTCGKVQTTLKSHKKNYCTTKCWYARNTLPNGCRVCTLCKKVKSNRQFTLGVARCKSCRTDATLAYVESIKKESFVKFVAYQTLQNLSARAPLEDRASMRPILEAIFLKAINGGTCPYCYTLITELNCSLDHIIPLSRGGTNALDNLHVSCLRCNLMKGNLGHEAFLAWRGWLVSLGEDDKRIFEARLLSGNSRFTRKR